MSDDVETVNLLLYDIEIVEGLEFQGSVLGAEGQGSAHGGMSGGVREAFHSEWVFERPCRGCHDPVNDGRAPGGDQKEAAPISGGELCEYGIGILGTQRRGHHQESEGERCDGSRSSIRPPRPHRPPPCRPLA